MQLINLHMNFLIKYNYKKRTKKFFIFHKNLYPPHNIHACVNKEFFKVYIKGVFGCFFKLLLTIK